MEFKNLGGTGIKVSRLCMGTMSFGGDADEAASRAMFSRCRDAGINFFDCADVYEQGRSEEILGGLIRGCRDELVITTKAYFPTGEGPNDRGASRRHLRHGIEASLRRLGTSYVDVFFVHRFDENTPLEETMVALNDLVREGKALYIGASNFAAWQFAKARGISEARRLEKFQVIQPMYNLVKRQAEVEILAMAESEGIAVTPYSPLAAGLLTGKYRAAGRPSDGRLVSNEMYRTRYEDEAVFRVAEDFAALAERLCQDPASLAVAWVATHPAVTAPIIGARNVEQLESSLAALEIGMTSELRAEISALSPEPPPATDRSEERAGDMFSARLAHRRKAG